MAARDPYFVNIKETGAHRNAVVVVPSDANDLTDVTRGLYVGVAGNLCVNMTGVGVGVVIPVAAGLHPLCVSRVLATGTTATGIVAVW